MSITPSHHEVHQRMREQVRKMGLPVQITRKLRDGAEVMAIMPDEYTIKRKHWTMGSVTFKCIMDCLRALKKDVGVQQVTVWAMLTDLLIEFTNAKLEDKYISSSLSFAGIHARAVCHGGKLGSA